MVVTVPIKLRLEPAQRAELVALLARLNEACSWLAQQAWPTTTRSAFALHKLFYRELRTRFGLASQHAVRVLGTVSATFATKPQHCPRFRPEAAFPFDANSFTVFAEQTEVSLRGDGKRLRVPFFVAHAQRPLLAQRERLGEADLSVRKGKVYLYVSVSLDDDPVPVRGQFLGVDLGLVNLATDSDGRVYSGANVERVRQKYHRLRQQLQTCGSRSARRALTNLAGKEARFRQIENHRIANELVKAAEGTSRGLALEELRGIRERTTVRRQHRARHSGWAFAQLRALLTYKALATGVELVFVDPRDTSRTCPRCHHVARENRVSREEFRCVRCGHEGKADEVAAENISQKAEVNRLNVPRKEGGSAELSSGSRAQVSGRKRRGQSSGLQAGDRLRRSCRNR